MMIDYLYYKIYKATSKGSLSDIPHIVTPIYFGGLIGINILVLYLFLVKVDVVPYLFRDVRIGGLLIAILIGLSMLYFGKERRTSILEKYTTEENSSRVKGNFVVIIYVVISFLLIFAVGFFRPGKL